MSPGSLIRASALSCLLGGACLIAFVLIHPWDRLIGAANALDPRWQLAHRLHFVGAIFALLGLPGLYACQRHQLGTFGMIGFALSVLGNAMFLGTGMITGFIWPMLAMCAPQSVELGGALFGWLGSAFIYELPLFGPAIFIGCLAYLSAAEWHRVLRVLALIPGLDRLSAGSQEEITDSASKKANGPALVASR